MAGIRTGLFLFIENFFQGRGAGESPDPAISSVVAHFIVRSKRPVLIPHLLDSVFLSIAINLRKVGVPVLDPFLHRAFVDSVLIVSDLPFFSVGPPGAVGAHFSVVLEIGFGFGRSVGMERDRFSLYFSGQIGKAG